MDTALVSAGIDLIFFIGIRLYFGFSMRIMLVVTEQCLPQIKDFWLSHALPESRCTTSCEGSWPGELTQTDLKNIPHQRISSPVHKMGVVDQDGPVAAWRLDGHLSVAGEHLHSESIVSLGFYFFLCSLPFSLLFNFSVKQLLLC